MAAVVHSNPFVGHFRKKALPARFESLSEAGNGRLVVQWDVCHVQREKHSGSTTEALGE